VQPVVAVELVDLTRNEIIWESRCSAVKGSSWTPPRPKTWAQIAVALLKQRIIDGAQSNW
jgi:hypothetical protein